MDEDSVYLFVVFEEEDGDLFLEEVSERYTNIQALVEEYPDTIYFYASVTCL